MASGNVLWTLIPEMNMPPTSNYATRDSRNGHSVLDMDDTTDESAVFKLYIPPYYSGGGITVDIYASFTSATSGNAIFQAAIERVTDSNQDIDSDGFASAQSSSATAVPGTSGHVKKFTVTFTDGAQMDSLAAGEWGRIKINRDADNGSDTASGDAEFWSATIKET